MAFSYRARRRWSLIILLVGLPVYVVLAVTILNWLGRPPFVVELLVYVVLGVVWALPFRMVFRGIGKPDPDGVPSATAETETGPGDDPAG